MLADIARAHDARYVRTLTGFKWVFRAARELERDEGVRFVFGYEEALGYSVGNLVRDKDGISAAVVFADVAAECKARGESVLERLRRLYEEPGLWVSAQKSVALPGPDGMVRILAAVSSLAQRPPDELAGQRVLEVTDYRKGAESRPSYLGYAALVELLLEAGGRVLARPSGTEPKLKIYVDLSADVQSEVRQGVSVGQVQEKLEAAAANAADALALHLGLLGEQ
jgi:phosphomannomutase